MVEIAPNLAVWNGDARAPSLVEAQEEYRRLLASLNELGSQLFAFQTTLENLLAPGLPEAHLEGVPTGYAAPFQHPEPEPERDASIKISLLGPFQFSIGGSQRGQYIPRQVRTVLEFLVGQGRRPTSRDVLLDLLWPDAIPNVAASRLRVVMHTLRKCVPCDGLGFHELVVTSGNNFMLNPQATVWVDVEEFERHWLNGWRLVKAGQTQEALREYEQAEALYTGDYLEDEPYADWTLLRREALRDAYANILTMLAAMSLEAGDYTGTIIWSQKLLAQDNCREDAYRLLMTSHLRLGQTSRAAHWYKLCAWSLQRELGIEPSEETRAVMRET
jgi:DNA-binding SARP family transcriptional activator